MPRLKKLPGPKSDVESVTLYKIAKYDQNWHFIVHVSYQISSGLPVFMFYKPLKVAGGYMYENKIKRFNFLLLKKLFNEQAEVCRIKENV